MGQTILPLALLFSIPSLDAFAPQRQCHRTSTSVLSAQRTEKKRRFLQSAHPIPPTKADNTNAVRKSSDTSRDRWSAPKEMTASTGSRERWTSAPKQSQVKPNNQSVAPPTDTRIRPPLQTSKSIEELEAILESRWGTADTTKTSKSDDGEFVISFEDDDEPQSPTISSAAAPKSPVKVKSRRVKDPWEGMGNKHEKQEDVGEFPLEEEAGKQQRWFDRDDAMLKRVQSNQQRFRGKKAAPTRSDGSNVSIIGNKDYYDQDDEGYENNGSMIAPRPAGGRGRSAALDGGIFSARDDTVPIKPMDVMATKETDAKKKKPKRQDQQFEQVLDENGEPMFLTLEQAERIVDNIISSDQEGSSSSSYSNSETVEWQDVGITNPLLLSNLQSDEMICPRPLEVQIKACPPIIAGNDVLLSTHTGSGKTLAFLTPISQNIMVNPSQSTLPKALIVAPGRELASQIVSVAQMLFEGTNLTVGMVIGGTSYARNVEMLRTKKPDVVVGTPGRIAELILGKSGDKGGKLKLSNLQTVVLDEFDALLQYDAHKEPTSAIIDALDRQHPTGLQRVLCSATATDMMAESANSNVENYLRPGYVHASIDESDLLVTSGVTPTSKGKATRVSKTTIHGALHVPHQRYALEAVRRILNTDPVIHQALIFVDSPRRVEIVIEKLAQMDIIAAPLHGGASSGKGDRAEVSKALRGGFVGVVVATEMAARGLDAPYLTHVINLDLPTDASHFAHRVGRCGRGGRPGVAISITCSDKEKGVPKRFAEELGITMHDVEAREGKIRIIKRPVTTMSRHQCDQTEVNYVAEAFNWEQRVKGENDAARQWASNWSSVFAPNSPQTFSEKIKHMEKEMAKLPVCAMMSNSQMSYIGGKAYMELGKNYRRKSSWDEE